MADSLVFGELLAVEELALCRNVDPKAPLTADRTGAIDLESDAIMRDCRRGEVDIVAMLQRRRPVIPKGQQVDGRIWSHALRHDWRRDDAERSIGLLINNVAAEI